MSCGGKIFIAAALVGAIATAVYEGCLNQGLRSEIQVLRRERELVRENNAAFEKERTVVSNESSASSGPQAQTTELLRLRAEVTRLNKLIQEKPTSGGRLASLEGVSPEASLNEEQQRFLAEWTEGVRTKNSAADIGRLKDTLERWDELKPTMFPAKMEPALPILKQRVIERLAELEAEAAR